MKNRLFLVLLKQRNQYLLQLLVISILILIISLSIVPYEEEWMELIMLFIIKKETKLCSTIKISSQSVRFMLKTTNMKCELTQHACRQILGIIKVVTNKKVVLGLCQDNDPKAFIEETLKFVTNAEANVPLKVNCLSAMVRYPLTLDGISPVYKYLYGNSPLNFSPGSQVVYPRIFAEIGINHGFVNHYKSYIESSMVTGDSILTTSKTQPYPDKIDTYKNGKVIFGDIKSGNEMSKWPLKGTLGEVTYLNGKQLTFPNNQVDLDQFNLNREKLVNGHKSHFGISKEELDEFTVCTEKLKILNNNLNLDNVRKYMETEELMVRINMLAGQKRISFIHVKTCIEEELTANEKAFINLLGSRIENKAIFENQPKFNKFIIDALVLYHKTVDNTTKNNLLLLKYSNWKPTFIDEIDFTLFN